jgi:hypothetical protein
MNRITVPFSPFKLFKESVSFDTVSGRLKLGATVPVGKGLEGVRAMGVF